MKKYRIPEVEEFVQGFKFEKLIHRKGCKLGMIGIIDFGKESIFKESIFKEVVAEEDKWVGMEVWWDRESEPIKIEFENIIYEGYDCPEFDKPNWATQEGIQKEIEDCNIRVEIINKIKL